MTTWLEHLFGVDAMKLLSVRDLRRKTATRRAKAVAAVTEMQRRSAESGADAITVDEIDAEIESARRARAPRGDVSR